MRRVNSSIAFGKVRHWRAVPREHSFAYPIYTFQVDVDEADRCAVAPRLFGCDRCSLFTIRSSDYLDGEGTLREKVERWLRKEGPRESPARIVLITMPRFVGYIFNPVSFFACFDRDNRVTPLVTQVNNTFGETHVYPLMCEPSLMPVTWRFPKEFFVSPFFDTEGEYELTLGAVGEQLSIQVNLDRQGERVFSADLTGQAQALSRGSLMKVLYRYPLVALMTMPRIHAQALKLFFKAGACPFSKPPPNHARTIRSGLSVVHKARLWFLSLLRAYRY